MMTEEEFKNVINDIEKTSDTKVKDTNWEPVTVDIPEEAVGEDPVKDEEGMQEAIKEFEEMKDNIAAYDDIPEPLVEEEEDSYGEEDPIIHEHVEETNADEHIDDTSDQVTSEEDAPEAVETETEPVPSVVDIFNELIDNINEATNTLQEYFTGIQEESTTEEETEEEQVEEVETMTEDIPEVAAETLVEPEFQDIPEEIVEEPTTEATNVDDIPEEVLAANDEPKEDINYDECFSGGGAPEYYKGKNGIEVIDIIDGFFDDTYSFYLGNAVAYILRASKKNGLEDLKKADSYLRRIIAQMTVNENDF